MSPSISHTLNVHKPVSLVQPHSPSFGDRYMTSSGIDHLSHHRLYKLYMYKSTHQLPLTPGPPSVFLTSAPDTGSETQKLTSAFTTPNQSPQPTNPSKTFVFIRFCHLPPGTPGFLLENFPLSCSLVIYLKCTATQPWTPIS